MIDKEKQLPESTNLDEYLDTAIAETEYVSEEQLIDAREVLSDLKKKYFG